MAWYEIDLRDRRTGKSIECIYSGDDSDVAHKIADEYNRNHLADYDMEIPFCEYADGKDGIFADLYVLETKEELLGIGKIL